MTRSPTAAVREQAAQLCSAMASDRVYPVCNGWINIADALNTPLRARDLAWAAFDSVSPERCYGTPSARTGYWAEAEAMLRTGWSQTA